MNQNLFKKFEELARRDLADKAWLARNRALLLAYVRAHPKPASWLSRFMVPGFWFRMVPAALIIFVMLIGATGVSFASQDSIPGDFLYSWKVSVENIESAFIVGPQSRAAFEVGRTTKRLQEMTELAVRKPNDQKTAAEASQRLQAQVKTATEEIVKAASDDLQKALEAAVNLQSTLQAHKEVLDRLTSKVDSDSQSQIKSALDSIQQNSLQVHAKVQDLQAQTKDDLIKARATQNIQADAAAKLDETKKKIDAIWSEVMTLPDGSTLRDETEIKIDSAQNALSDAQDAYDGGAYDDAIIAVQFSSQLISDTSALLEAQQIAGETVKEILEGMATATVTPSTSATPATSPTVTPAPTTSIAPTETPLPRPIISVTLNKNTYVPDETIVITITATNVAGVPLSLQWGNGCQIDAEVDSFPTAIGRTCTAAASSVVLDARQTYTWTLTRTAPRGIGKHSVNAEFIGYSQISVFFQVADQ